MDLTDKTPKEIREIIGSPKVPLHLGIPVYEDPTMPHRDDDGSEIHCRVMNFPDIGEFVICSAKFMAEMKEKNGDKEQLSLVENTDDDL
jgi:hypothetical protein